MYAARCSIHLRSLPLGGLGRGAGAGESQLCRVDAGIGVLRRTIRHFEAGPCFYCGRPTFRPFDHRADSYPWAHTRDHVIPPQRCYKSKKRKRRHHNRPRSLVVPACRECNRTKGNAQPSQDLIARAEEYVWSQRSSTCASTSNA